MLETLKKKGSILQALLEATKRQTKIAEADEFDLDDFESNIDQKDVLLEQLNELDEGFDSVFQKIRSTLTSEKEAYRSQLSEIQDLIRKCVDLGVEIQTTEERNRNRLESVFAIRQKELRQIRTNSKTVSNYYKTMNPNQGSESYFMDQKK